MSSAGRQRCVVCLLSRGVAGASVVGMTHGVMSFFVKNRGDNSEKICKFAVMKTHNILLLAAAAVLLLGCRPSEEKQAEQLMTRIDSLYKSGRYQAALDSITSLRQRYPEAIEARRRALELWQEASLRLTQQDIARTDSALQVANDEYRRATSIRERNQIGMRRDSLQVRYDVLCGTVRVIHRRQQEK